MKLPRVCRCGRVVTGTCECQAIHTASADDHRPGKAQRYGKGWDDLSRRYRAKHPLCEACLVKGNTKQADDVHHRQKVKDRPDLLLQWDNLMSVCRACHAKIEARENT